MYDILQAKRHDLPRTVSEDAVNEFESAVKVFKQEQRVVFPTYADMLQVIIDLGYSKRPHIDADSSSAARPSASHQAELNLAISPDLAQDPDETTSNEHDLNSQFEFLLDDLPEDPEQRLEAIAKAYSDLRKATAAVLRPVIGELLSGISDADYERKAALARTINSVLQDARLAIQNPETGSPAKLLAHRPRPSSHVSSLRLRDTRKSASGEQLYLRVEDLDPTDREFELVPIQTERDPPKSERGR